MSVELVRAGTRLPARVQSIGLAVLLALALCLAAGCQSVDPWERGQLSAPRMQNEPHPAHAGFLDHVRQSREAATMGNGSGGGGCGCY